MRDGGALGLPGAAPVAKRLGRPYLIPALAAKKHPICLYAMEAGSVPGHNKPSVPALRPC